MERKDHMTHALKIYTIKNELKLNEKCVTFSDFTLQNHRFRPTIIIIIIIFITSNSPLTQWETLLTHLQKTSDDCNTGQDTFPKIR